MAEVPPSAFSMEDANARFNMGFPALVGFHFLEWEDGRAVLGLQVRPEHLNLGGVIHGGVLATLMDVAGACAGTYCADPARVRKAVTLSMTNTFTGQAGEGLIRAIGTRRAGGSRIYNSTMEVFDQQGELLAMGEGTFRLRSSSAGPAGEPV